LGSNPGISQKSVKERHQQKSGQHNLDHLRHGKNVHMQDTGKKKKKYSTGTALFWSAERRPPKRYIIAIKTIKTSPEVEIHIVMSIIIVLKVKILYIGSI
jgi:hypothetical protein